MRHIRDPRQRIAERSVRTTDGCLEWTGKRDKDGYGITTHPSGITRVHRLAWFLRNGPIPDGLIVCHRCDNPSCVEVDHLWIGTHRDNAKDREAKGRRRPSGVTGESHYRARLTEAQVLEMRENYHPGEAGYAQAMADRHGVPIGTVRSVLYGQTWKFLLDRQQG